MDTTTQSSGSRVHGSGFRAKALGFTVWVPSLGYPFLSV